MSSSPLQLSRSGASSPAASSDVPATPAEQRHDPATPAASVRSGLSGASGILRSTPGGSASSPFGVLRAASQRSRSTPGSVGRSDLGRRSVHSSEGPRSSAGRSDGHNDGASSGPNTFIWGTNVSVEETQKAFADFFDEYVDPDRPTDGPFYRAYLERQLEKEEFALNLDCSHIKEFDERLYKKLVAFPQEVVPIADLAVHEMYQRICGDEGHADGLGGRRFTVRCFNLGKEDRLRDLDPNDINRLVAIKGMVTRTSAIVPDLYMAFFECTVCGTPQEVSPAPGSLSPPCDAIPSSCSSLLTVPPAHAVPPARGPSRPCPALFPPGSRPLRYSSSVGRSPSHRSVSTQRARPSSRWPLCTTALSSATSRS